MIDQESVERAAERFKAPDGALERLIRRRDRKRRNQRIAAGLLGIAGFVAAVWVVTSGLSFDRSETSVVPGEHITGPAETGPPYGEPDVHRSGECRPAQGTEAGLELWDLGDRIRVRFHLLSLPGLGHQWRVVFRHTHIPAISPPEVIFQGTRVPRHNVPGRFRIIRYVTDLVGVDEFQARAVDTQTGQVCKAVARIE